MNRRSIETPAGRFRLTSKAGKLCEIALADAAEVFEQGEDDPVLDEAKRQLNAYFAGERSTFDLPLHMEGSAFDRAVWQRLLEIPFGQIKTYGQIAAELGKPNASRAVGGACSRNPLLIVVPCHRVVAGTGRLTGFAAGLGMKRTLLALEGWAILNDSIKI